MKFKILALLGAVACSLLIVAPARAGTPQEILSRSGHTDFLFVDRGDVFYVTDRDRDALASVGEYRLGAVSSSTTGDVWDHHGAGTRAKFDTNLREGTVVFIRACEGDFETRTVRTGSCSRWVRGVA